MKKIFLTTVLSLCAALTFAGCSGGGGTDMNTRKAEPVKEEQQDTREAPNGSDCPDDDCNGESFATDSSKDCPDGKCPKGDCPDNCTDDCPKKDCPKGDCPDGKCPSTKEGDPSPKPPVRGRGHRKTRPLPHRTENN